MNLKRPFKINCHAIGLIMTGGDDKLSQTAKTYVMNWIKAQPEFYGSRRRTVRIKYLEKGIECEPESIQLAANYYGWGSVVKNTTRIENEYMTGEPDIVLTNRVVDMKSSWDEDTFPIFEPTIPDPKYVWQVQGYMELFGKPHASVVYALMNTPEHLIEAAARMEQKRLGLDDLEEDLYQQFVEMMTFDDLDLRLRLKRYDFQRSKYDIERVYAKVEQIRAWIYGLPDYIEDEVIY
jgi:hypothetical protein